MKLKTISLSKSFPPRINNFQSTWMIYVWIYLLDKSCPPAVTVLDTASREMKAISKELTVSVLTWVPCAWRGPLERWRMSRSEPRKKTGRTPQTYGTACTETQRPEESGNTVGRQIPQDWRKEVGEERGLVRRRGQKEDRARWGASQKTKQRTLHGSETPLDAIAMFLWPSRPQSVILRHSDH